MENKEQSKYGCITRKQIKDTVTKVFNEKSVKDRNFKFYVYFNNQKEADNWMEMFNNICKEEIKKIYNE